MPIAASPFAAPAADPDQVGRAIAQMAPAGVETTVETRETHISWLFLTGDRAYKLKKPLVLSFLDYGTPQRRREMCLAECHGDLRAEHVLLGPVIRVVDCVEFDVGLRTLDVADDLAFLVMDLAALGGERYARELIDAYRAAGGDCGSDAVLAFFAVHRALVRAKVMLVRADQHPPESDRRLHARPAAEALLALAQRFAWQARGPLAIVICGLPASGKSSVAAALSAASGLPQISSDIVRKQLAGLAPQERGSPELYAPDFDALTYAELGRRAADRLGSQAGVIVDATFRHRRDRGAFYDAFGDAAPLLFVQCEAPAHVLARRAEARERDPARVSDADLEVVLRERDAWEPLGEIPADACLTLRTDRGVEATLADLTALVDQRGRP